MSFAGDLADLDVETQATRRLVAAAHRVHHGHAGDLVAVAAKLRAAFLYILHNPRDDSVTVVRGQGDEIAWLPVFTDQRLLTDFQRHAGPDAEPVRYLGAPGGEVIDELLPLLPSPTGLLLDPGAPHAVVLPPVPSLLGGEATASGARHE
ncbi:SseB family protein [Saccharopolyspora soli]|uniref:SseB family protein n=1 Tax=Saccharopolyspora soli TaxID=2926618 RepID=UPI001F5A3D88|nr:SseB family protein [Saccharopolyspora soli]